MGLVVFLRCSGKSLLVFFTKIDFKMFLYNQSLSLNLMTLNPECSDVMTAKGVPVSVSGVARVKVMREAAFL